MAALDIGIPAYRRREGLCRAVESALAQRGDGLDVRVFIVNDCPEEDLSGTAGKYGVELFNNDRNLGLVRNWNRVVELARSPYLIVLHDDDQLLSGMARAAVGELEGDTKAGMVFGAAEIVNSKGGRDRCFSPFRGRRTFTGESGVLSLVENSVPVKAPTVCYRLESLRSAGGFCEACEEAADVEMYLKLALLGTVIYTGKTMARYSFDAANLTFSRMFRERDMELLSEVKLKLHAALGGSCLDEKAWDAAWGKMMLRHAEISAVYRMSVGDRETAFAVLGKAEREVKNATFSSYLELRAARTFLSLPGAGKAYRIARWLQGWLGKVGLINP